VCWRRTVDGAPGRSPTGGTHSTQSVSTLRSDAARQLHPSCRARRGPPAGRRVSGGGAAAWAPRHVARAEVGRSGCPRRSATVRSARPRPPYARARRPSRLRLPLPLGHRDVPWRPHSTSTQAGGQELVYPGRVRFDDGQGGQREHGPSMVTVTSAHVAPEPAQQGPTELREQRVVPVLPSARIDEAYRRPAPSGRGHCRVRGRRAGRHRR